MIIDGKSIAEALNKRVARYITSLGVPLTLGIAVVGSDPVIDSFVRIKKRVAGEVGVNLSEFHFSETIDTETLVREVTKLSANETLDGLIVQLPLPPHIVAQTVLNAVVIDKDVDMLSHEAAARFSQGSAKTIPPVAGAIQEIFELHNISVGGKDVLILGHGRLVGAPAALLLRHNHAHVTVVDKEVKRLSSLTREADIIISGVGQQGILVPEMLKKGVVLIDAGTSEDGGKIVGDADPRCADVSLLFTPVPGGVGPITVSMIFKNISILAAQRLDRKAN